MDCRDAYRILAFAGMYLVIAIVATSEAQSPSSPAARLDLPLGLDAYMPVPEENLLTVEKMELGRRLFSDRRLSRDGSIACASCHDPDRASSG